MGTENSVRDEKRKLTDEELGKLYKKTNETVKRIEGRSILFEDAISGMQDIIEGKSKRLKLGLISGKSKRWWERDGVIYFIVISDGTSGKQWIERLKKVCRITEYAKELLLSEDFKPTVGIVYTIAILKGDLFADCRSTENICLEAAKRNLVAPSLEAVCLVREMLSDYEIEAMGLTCIAFFHKAIKNSHGDLNILRTGRTDGGTWLQTTFDNSDYWSSDSGFTFEYSRKQIA